MTNDQIIIYQDPNGETTIDVKLVNESIWLNQYQLAELFNTDRTSLLKHIKNIYSTGELVEDSTCARFAQVQQEGKRNIKRDILHYNLDLVISVGYRVNSKRGTQFRIWANKVLKEYLVKGFAVNELKLKERSEQYQSLKQTVALLGNVLQNKEHLNSDEATGLLKVITDYSYALDILDQYDHQQLKIEGTADQQLFIVTYEEAIQAIKDLKDKFGGSSLFGNEKDQSFKGSIGTIYQSFGGVEFYPTIEEKAANLLYFIVKNHSFSDGNKRIAAYLFVWFLEKNNILYHTNGTKRIADNALVALTLMIAESRPDEKDMMVKVVVNLINPNN
ncbi:Fic/DOC family protein [Mucilaginibacter rubeus]|uniref:Fic/DOC family protein n=1 Tax=Mucilaginibacter rubeus TaxID=2027860 RepID=A0AAE6JNL7_9SPHI|nr:MULTISPECIES: virulence protein RhuM/Fic/DOC family protein [Mucilaginibacter]QEM07907.1 Fic/DOC family protein [Mucilaginibacter rubeus]QEM20359.1 Fic/DOC family protein [Mucilaginibacter gossypii]QTE42921.1 virulence protein RhuM/Fic/DOC family protein [Mucilaginibacter rubeus]QTE49522.1 virulence protein RhuM/Fic/DOC family protein [Mucilaginibacter rubeus]QTE54618.1 virulence protein RhuM/Fic/DOC family protein [Mucilaginibacter rubeus]